MKKVALILMACLGFASMSVAQEGKTASKSDVKKQNKDLSPEERAKKASQHAAKKLTLNEEQKANWEVAALKRIMVNQPIKEKLKGSTTPEERKQMHQQIRENNKAFDESVNGFLTDTQKVSYEKWKAEKRKKGKPKKGKDEPEPSVDE
ncbi:MAG: hypothetical protein AB7O73_06895 [Bacteroidia bacterium]